MTPTGLEEPAETRGNDDDLTPVGYTGGYTLDESRLTDAIRQLSPDDRKRVWELIRELASRHPT